MLGQKFSTVSFLGRKYFTYAHGFRSFMFSTFPATRMVRNLIQFQALGANRSLRSHYVAPATCADGYKLPCVDALLCIFVFVKVLSVSFVDAVSCSEA